MAAINVVTRPSNNAGIREAFAPGNTVALHHGNDVGTQWLWKNGRFLRMESNGNVNGDGGWQQLMKLSKYWVLERFTVYT